MNFLAHILINYSILWFFIPDIRLYLGPIVLFSAILDIDHIPEFIKYFFFVNKKEKHKMEKRHCLGYTRTALQEPANVILITIMLLAFYFWLGKPVIILIGILCLILHLTVDILTVYIRPFYPLNRKGFLLFFKKSIRSRLMSEFIITIVAILLFTYVWLH